jgi:CubicO group peptidase (beta-lactamase class C family)
MKRYGSLYVWLSGIVLLSSLSLGPTRQSKPDFAEIEKVALEEMRQLNTPGAAVGIVSGDRLVYTQGVGIANVETGAALTPEMLFRLGSTTKMFTAAALISLAEANKIMLQEPIGLVVSGLDSKIAEVSAHQLLTHTSGFLDEAPMYGSQDESALSKEVQSWKEDHFFTKPGDIYSYSNPGYWLAGYLVEYLSGKSYADAMSEIVFGPFKMTRTTLRPTMAMTYPLAQGHDVDTGKPAVVRPAANNAASWPAGSIFSNVFDLSRFVIAFVNGGKIDGKQVLSPTTISTLAAPFVDIPGSDGAHYGYGLEIRDQRGVHTLKHSGSRSGYGSLIWMVPEHHFGVIILANRTGANLAKTAEKAMETLLPLAPPGPPSVVTELAFSEEEKAVLPGIYVHPPSQRVEIVLKEGNLSLRRGSTDLPLRKTGPDRISAAGADTARGQQYVVVRGKDGKTLYLFSGGRAMKKS